MAEIKKVGCERLELGALSGKTMGPGGSSRRRASPGGQRLAVIPNRSDESCGSLSPGLLRESLR